MAGIAEGIPGAKAFDEVLEQEALVTRRNLNNGKPPKSSVVIEPASTNEFQRGVLSALGVGGSLVATA